MPQSSEIYDQIRAVQGQMDPYLNNPNPSGWFGEQIGKLFNYNLPAIQNAQALESKAYTLPGDLMTQYDKEYGGNLGVGSMSRMNSILENIGNQFGLVNTARGIVDQAKVRQEDLAGKLTDQYTAQLGALKDKNAMLMPMWERMYAEEQANKRARGAGGTTKQPIDWNKVGQGLGGGTTNTVPNQGGSTTPVATSVAPNSNFNPQALTRSALGLGTLPTTFPTIGNGSRTVSGGIVY